LKFHGNRDFYHLIICAMRELIKVKNDINEVNKDKILTKIGLMAFTRNFGGLSNSLDIINLSLKMYIPIIMKMNYIIIIY